MTQLDRTLSRSVRSEGARLSPLGTLGDFLDARIGSARRTLVQAHLERCPACTNRLLDLRELARLEQEGEAPPADLLEQPKGLARSNESASEPRPSLRQRLYPIWVATLRALRPQPVLASGSRSRDQPWPSLFCT